MSNEPARILEIIFPAGFERFFAELTDLTYAAGPPDPAMMAAGAAREGVELDFPNPPHLLEEYGLTFGPGAQ